MEYKEYETQKKKVWELLHQLNYVTVLFISHKYNILHLPAIIRDLRKKYGYSTILDKWIYKTETYKDAQGNERKRTKRHKQYFLNKMSGVA
jgi:hypothetical protein